jgi:hypothetical protein
VPPYVSWSTAAATIQDAVDAATVAGAIVLVTNGIYASGGREAVGPFAQSESTRVNVDKPLSLRSVNGAANTLILGSYDDMVRCVYLIDGASLSGFTITNGAAKSGAGILCQSTNSIVSNCMIVSNSALSFGNGGGVLGGTLINCWLSANFANNDFGGTGGGAFNSTLYNCIVSGNSAPIGGGGGVSHSTLYNCTLVGNRANGDTGHGGGAESSILNNCIIYLNTATHGPDVVYCTLNHCCTPLSQDGGWPESGTVTNLPGFVDYGNGDLRLRSDSPCINAGDNRIDSINHDLDGHSRIIGGTIDIGAYEFPTPASSLSYAWLQRFHLSADGSADDIDSDGDGMTNRQEWQAGTDPTDPSSLLHLFSPIVTATAVTVRWQSVSGTSYFLERSTALGASVSFTAIATNIVGQPGTTTFNDVRSAQAETRYYRVGVTP